MGSIMVAELLAPDSLPPTSGDDQVGGEAPPQQTHGAGAHLCLPCCKVKTTESANTLGTGNYMLPPCAHAWCACPVDPTSTHNLCCRCDPPPCHHCWSDGCPDHSPPPQICTHDWCLCSTDIDRGNGLCEDCDWLNAASDICYHCWDRCPLHPLAVADA